MRELHEFKLRVPRGVVGDAERRDSKALTTALWRHVVTGRMWTGHALCLRRFRPPENICFRVSAGDRARYFLASTSAT